jgi:NADH-quinone oxidoreductase subunit F
MIIKEMLAANKLKCQERADKLPEITAAQSVVEGTCPLQWCLEVVKAARAEACGKSVMCRDGLWQLQLMIESATRGQSNEEDLVVLKETLDAMETLGCPNTQKVAQLLKANMETYASEWDLHVRRNRCSSMVCYYDLYIDPATCNGCGECLKAAPAGAVLGGEGMINVIKTDRELKNDGFIASCPVGAIKKCGAVKPPVPPAPVAVGSFGAAGGAAGGGRRRRRG